MRKSKISEYRVEYKVCGENQSHSRTCTYFTREQVIKTFRLDEEDIEWYRITELRPEETCRHQP